MKCDLPLPKLPWRYAARLRASRSDAPTMRSALSKAVGDRRGDDVGPRGARRVVDGLRELFDEQDTVDALR
jgi:hypothetical protein